MNRKRLIAAVIAAVSICAMSACTDGETSDVYSTVEVTAEVSAELAATEESTAPAKSAEQSAPEAETAEPLETAQTAEPDSGVLFSDSFDYDGDGTEEQFTFHDIGAGEYGGCLVSVIYTDGADSCEVTQFEQDAILQDSFFTQEMNGQRFVGAVTDLAVGAGMPAVCFTVVNEIPQQVGEELTYKGDDGYRFLAYEGDKLMVRDCGPAAGVNNLYPVYWSGELRVCDTAPADMSFVREADVNGIVGDIENVTSVLIRTNGLLHINYIADDGNVNSVTYIMKGTQIKELYDPEAHAKLGRYLTCIEVKQIDSHALVAVPAIGYTQQEIQTLLSDFGSFCYAYVDGKAFRLGSGYDTSDFITETFTRDDGSTYEDIWYRVTDEVLPDYQALKDLAAQYCTSDMLNSLEYIFDHLYKEQDGKLYVWQHAGSGGSLLGTDYAYVTSVEQDGWSLIMHMNAYGSKENWDTEEDFSEAFEVQQKRENGVLKVDVCGIRERGYLAYAYNPSADSF